MPQSNIATIKLASKPQDNGRNTRDDSGLPTQRNIGPQIALPNARNGVLKTAVPGKQGNMYVTAVTTETMKPMMPMGNSIVATGSTGQSTAAQTSAVVDAATERMDQLIQLINRFSPAEVMTALRMAKTTYLQSQASAPVTAAAIELQIASQQSAAATLAIQYSSLQSHRAMSGSNLNISG